MIKRRMESIAATWVAGLLVLLPLALTLAVLAWAFSLVNRFVGPSSIVGRLFAALGYPFFSNPELQYASGTLLLIAAIYLLGLIAQAGLKHRLQALTARALRRIPLVGGLYGFADRFVSVLDRKGAADIGAMSPVWCFFGGHGGAAVLALAPGAEAVEIDGRRYLPVLIPTAPIPFSGALVYVPADCLRPAQIGVDTLTATYVSLGITSPRPAGPAGTAPAATLLPLAPPRAGG
jgi:uncharacterized membrane protein